MIDIKLVRDDPDRVRASQRARGEDPSLVDVLLAADEQRRAAVLRFDTVRAAQKTLGKEVASARTDAEKQALLARAKDLAAEVREAEAEQSTADDTLRDATLALSNVIEPGVPEGGEDDFALLATVGNRAVVRLHAARSRRARARSSVRSTSSAPPRSPVRASTT